MGILPPDIAAQLPPLHAQDTLPNPELRTYAKLTVKAIGFTWFVLELHSDGDLFSAYLINKSVEQFGYFSFSYLEEHLGAAAFHVVGEIPDEGVILSIGDVTPPIVYDKSFTPKRLLDAVTAERAERRAHGERQPKDTSLARYRAYYYAAHYSQPAQAKQAFATIREIIHHEPNNLSAFNVAPGAHSLQWTVVVIGDRPAEQVHTRIMKAFQGGIFTTIPYEMLMQMFARKLEENQKGEWRESHKNIVLKRKGGKNRRKKK